MIGNHSSSGLKFCTALVGMEHGVEFVSVDHSTGNNVIRENIGCWSSDNWSIVFDLYPQFQSAFYLSFSPLSTTVMFCIYIFLYDTWTWGLNKNWMKGLNVDGCGIAVVRTHKVPSLLAFFLDSI